MATPFFTRGMVLTDVILNQLAESFAAFTGGTVPNATVFQSSFYVGMSGVNRAVSITPTLTTAPLVSDAAQLYSLFEVAAVGGSLLVASNIRAQTNISGAPNGQVWNLLGVVDYGGTGGNGLHVPVYGQSVRRTWNAGGTFNNPQLWGGIFECRDLTGQPSSATNYSLALEVDLFGNGLDDADKRQGIVLVLGKHNTGGANFQANAGIRLTQFTPGDSYKTAIAMETPFSVAGLDFRISTRLSGHTVWLGTGHDIAMDPGGVNTIYYDAAAVSGVGATRFQGNVEIDGTAFYLPNAVSTFGAAATFAAAVSVNTILTVAASRGLKFSSQTSGAAAQTATLTNAPAAGNPAFWIPVTVNGVNYQIPAWTG